MNAPRRRAALAAALAAALSAFGAAADSKRLDERLVAHYSVLASADLPAEVVRAYGIVRGGRHGLVNVALRRQRADGDDVAVAAAVSGTWSDLVHRHALEFAEIREAEAIYYLAKLRFNHRETMHFELTLRLLPDGPSHTLRFRHALYAD